MKNLNLRKKLYSEKKKKKEFEEADKCYACGCEFENEEFRKMDELFMNDKITPKEFEKLLEKEKKIEKVRDHCHITGKYRGAACCSCNLRMRIPKFVPVIFHNLENYDSHLFIKNLGVTSGDVNCIPKTEEKYISFLKKIVIGNYFNKKLGKYVDDKVEIRFIDSFKFMASSLEKLGKNVNPNELNILKKFYDEEERKLLQRKGIFPYDWFDNIEKLDEKKLPPWEEFYSKLNKKNISDKDYKHALKVWDYFNIKNMREYHNLYLKTEVLLLADVFENFRSVCKKNYKLDPAWYFTSRISMVLVVLDPVWSCVGCNVKND